MFSIEIHHYHHFDEDDVERLDRIEQSLDSLMEKIMAIEDDLLAAVTRNSDAEASVITLLNGISQQLKDALNSSSTEALSTAVKTAIDKLDANTAAAAAAVVANTTPPSAPVAAPN